MFHHGNNEMRAVIFKFYHTNWSYFDNTQQDSTNFSRMLGEDGKMIRDATEEIEKKATPGNFFEIDIEKTLNYRDTGE